jgi:hypothetical protein
LSHLQSHIKCYHLDRTSDIWFESNFSQAIETKVRVACIYQRFCHTGEQLFKSSPEIEIAQARRLRTF